MQPLWPHHSPGLLLALLWRSNLGWLQHHQQQAAEDTTRSIIVSTLMKVWCKHQWQCPCASFEMCGFLKTCHKFLFQHICSRIEQGKCLDWATLYVFWTHCTVLWPGDVSILSVVCPKSTCRLAAEWRLSLIQSWIQTMGLFKPYWWPTLWETVTSTMDCARGDEGHISWTNLYWKLPKSLVVCFALLC